MKVASGFTSSAALALACLGLLNMGGCTTTSGLDTSSKFSCSAPDGATCCNIAIGGRLGVTGAPTLMPVDDRKFPGLAPAERIAQWIDAGAGASR